MPVVGGHVQTLCAAWRRSALLSLTKHVADGDYSLRGILTSMGAVFVPETEIAGAEEVAARIRRYLEQMTFRQAPGLVCTVSLGASEANRDIANIDAWIQRADAALYRAKEGGRDRFEGAVAVDAGRGETRIAGA